MFSEFFQQIKTKKKRIQQIINLCIYTVQQKKCDFDSKYVGRHSYPDCLFTEQNKYFF